MPGFSNRPARATLCLLLMGLSTLALTACGGGGGKKVDPEDWVADLCDAAVDFEDDLANIGQDADDIDLTGKNAKKDVLAVFSDQKKAIADFKKAYEKIGIPDSKNGKKIDEAIQATFKEREDFINDLSKAVNKLDTGKRFEDDLSEAFGDLDEPDSLLTRLEDLDERDADDVLDLINENGDCSSTLAD